MTIKQRVVRSVGIISLATMMSRILGYLRDGIDASLFGTGLVADAYRVAFYIPNLLRDLLAEGALNSAFVPVFTEYFTKKGEKEAWRLASLVLNVLLLILVIVVGLGIIFAPYIVTAVAPGFIKLPEKLSLTIRLTRILFPFIAFMSLAALAMGILNSCQHFVIPAIAPTMLNISMISFGLFICPRLEEPIYGWALGALVGGLGQLLIHIPMLVKKRMEYDPDLDLNHPGVRKMGYLLIPALFGLSITRVNILVDTQLASLLKEGSVNFLYYGYRLMHLPLGVFGIAVATAVFPTLARQVTKGEMDDFKGTLSFALRLILFITIPATVGLVILSVPLIRLLFEHGKFGPEATLNSAKALTCYSLGLFAYAGVKVLVPAFYSLEDTKTPVKVGAIVVATNILLNLILMRFLEHAGLALATSIAAMVNLSFLFWILRKRVGKLGGRRIISSSLRILAASLFMGLACLFVFSILKRGGGSLSWQLYQVGGSILAGLVTYILFSFLFRIEELKSIRGIFRREEDSRSMPLKSWEV